MTPFRHHGHGAGLQLFDGVLVICERQPLLDGGTLAPRAPGCRAPPSRTSSVVIPHPSDRHVHTAPKSGAAVTPQAAAVVACTAPQTQREQPHRHRDERRRPPRPTSGCPPRASWPTTAAPSRRSAPSPPGPVVPLPCPSPRGPPLPHSRRSRSSGDSPQIRRTRAWRTWMPGRRVRVEATRRRRRRRGGGRRSWPGTGSLAHPAGSIVTAGSSAQIAGSTGALCSPNRSWNGGRRTHAPMDRCRRRRGGSTTIRTSSLGASGSVRRAAPARQAPPRGRGPPRRARRRGRLVDA